MNEVRIVGNDLIISVDEVIANMENAALIEDNKRLQTENEQLRRERDFYFQQVTENGERANGAIDALNAENAKLRELCGELYHELYAAIDEYWPASFLGDLEPRDVFPRYDELIELGVDV